MREQGEQIEERPPTEVRVPVEHSPVEEQPRARRRIQAVALSRGRHEPVESREDEVRALGAAGSEPEAGLKLTPFTVPGALVSMPQSGSAPSGRWEGLGRPSLAAQKTPEHKQTSMYCVLCQNTCVKLFLGFYIHLKRQ